jgi:hypothetical protein
MSDNDVDDHQRWIARPVGGFSLGLFSVTD